MTHIFIVNEKTFKIHLNYLFAGTGYGNNEPDFIDKIKKGNADKIEKTYTEMISDISKVRPGDKVAFYVTGCKKIFGFFKIAGNPFFVSQSDDILYQELEKYLPLRVKIEPDEVYAEGITEIEALDEIADIQHPYQMCWCLIYRKLTGMRGCSFITDYEYKRLKSQIVNKNNGVLQGKFFSYDNDKKKIIETNKKTEIELDTGINLDIKTRMLSVTKSFERHLQAYIMQNFDKNPLKELLIPNDIVDLWIGNEVVCSFGEQRIDILILSQTEEKYQIRIIELKDDYPHKKIIEQQILWYVKWVQQYIVPNLTGKDIEIIPTVIAARYKINSKGKKEFYNACKIYNDTLKLNCNSNINAIEYISFVRKENDISFTKEF